MKFSTTLLLSMAAAVSAKITKSVELPSSLKASSRIGKKVLSQARKLEQEDEEVDLSWVVDYSLKFQGCHHITQWNGDADGDEDVRIATKRLVRFRLCPTDSCDSESAGGCSSGYGEYIIDMNTYLMSYLEDLEETQQWTCENYENNICGCGDDDGKDDAFDEDECLNECYGKYGLDYCIEEEADDAAGEAFELQEYIECAQFEAPNNDRRRAEEEEVAYYIGPYCSDQGGKIYLGMFTDDSCSEFADEYGGTATYEGFMGESLPYASSSVIGMECVTCAPLQDADEDENGGDDDGEVEIKEACEQLWQTAGKCENNLNAVDDPNKNACNYMDGIKIIRSNGVVQGQRGSSSAAAFIGVFSVSSALLGGYVYYLTTKLSKSKIDIN